VKPIASSETFRTSTKTECYKYRYSTRYR